MIPQHLVARNRFGPPPGRGDIMTQKLPRKILRRLVAAEGFLELEMPQQALEELAAVDDFGPLEMPAQYLKGKAFKAQERYEDAIPALQRAARLAPAPLSPPIWRMLGECLRQRGQTDLADVADTFASASAPVAAPMQVLNVQITIVVAAGESQENDDDEMDDEFGDDSTFDELEPDGEVEF